MNNTPYFGTWITRLALSLYLLTGLLSTKTFFFTFYLLGNFHTFDACHLSKPLPTSEYSRLSLNITWREWENVFYLTEVSFTERWAGLQHSSMKPIIWEAVVPFKQQFCLTDSRLLRVHCTSIMPIVKLRSEVPTCSYKNLQRLANWHDTCVQQQMKSALLQSSFLLHDLAYWRSCKNRIFEEFCGRSIV